jgi:hypothetical protein
VQVAWAQDTVVVQTLTLDSASRSGYWHFPDDTTTWRKIYMRYRMRCHDALVGTGSVGCREWDYNCYTAITDSSRLDSTRMQRSSHAISNFSGTVYNIAAAPTYTYTDYLQRSVSYQAPVTETAYTISGAATPTAAPFGTSTPQSRTQFLWTAAQLSGSGLSAGMIEGLELDLSSIGAAVNFLRIRIKGTSQTTLDPNAPALLGSGDEVYFLNTAFSATGWQRFRFHNGFSWNGTDNLLVEVCYQNAAPGTNSLVNAANVGNGYVIQSSTADNYLYFSGAEYADLAPGPLSTISSQVTVAFWAYGDASLPLNTTIIEGTNTGGGRELNVHGPWSDGRFYWDCGADANGYDRIDIAVTPADYKGKWTHWAFTKNASTGQMFIYKNGVLFHSGTGKTKLIDLAHLRLGQALTGSGMVYAGGINDLQVWDVALDAPTIQAWMHRDLLPAHPFYSNLRAWYKLDEGSGSNLVDASPQAGTGTLVGAPLWRAHKGHTLHRNFQASAFRPNVRFYRGPYNATVTNTIVRDSVLAGQNQVIAYAVTGTDLVTVDTNFYYRAGWSYVYNEAGQLTDSVAVPVDSMITLSTLTYYEKLPARYEILSFVTPYGNNLDLGQDGVMWEFDVTDYAPILKGWKRLAVEGVGNYQEELDIQFVFIEGTPVRPVLDIHQLWPAEDANPWGASLYDYILNDEVLEPRSITLNPSAAAYKLRSAITGHGQNGEFTPRWHYLNVDGGPQEYRWQVWKECANIPIYPQGGTWLFDRAGWCPGDPTDVKEFELGSLATPGQTISIDYGMAAAANTSASDYRVNNQLVTYGPTSFSLDAGIERVKRPTKETRYKRFNPACSEPIVILVNEGTTPLTSATITYNRKGGSTRSYQWTGNLNFLERAEVVLPIDNPTFWVGSDPIFEVQVSNPNGGQDQHPDNDRYAVEYAAWDVFPIGQLEFNWRTNNNGQQTTWKLFDENGTLVLQNTPFLTAATTYTEAFNLPAGCYTLRVDDAADDGLYYWFTPANGQGFARMRYNGAITKIFPPEFGRFFQYDFYTEGPVGTAPENAQRFFVAPNPSTGLYRVELQGFNTEEISLQVFDLQGRIVQSSTQSPNGGFLATEIDLSMQPAGTYLLRLQAGSQSLSRTLIKQ